MRLTFTEAARYTKYWLVALMYLVLVAIFSLVITPVGGVIVGGIMGTALTFAVGSIRERAAHRSIVNGLQSDPVALLAYRDSYVSEANRREAAHQQKAEAAALLQAEKKAAKKAKRQLSPSEAQTVRGVGLVLLNHALRDRSRSQRSREAERKRRMLE
ncbi:MAG: hypothetical protein LBH13_07455 [Cellulomonadaceae bacterium]|jgi:hypothetical protein|nr:hypothetical protein [Cellulomonadaceae bacterium]